MGNATPIFKKGNQPNLSFWEGCVSNPPGSHIEAYEEQKGVWEQSAWIYKGLTVPKQPDSFL